MIHITSVTYVSIIPNNEYFTYNFPSIRIPEQLPDVQHKIIFKLIDVSKNPNNIFFYNLKSSF